MNYKTAIEKVVIVCPIHGEFLLTPTLHLKGCGCPICHSSKGERAVMIALKNLDVKFEKDKFLDGCVSKNKLEFVCKRILSSL